MKLFFFALLATLFPDISFSNDAPVVTPTSMTVSQARKIAQKAFECGLKKNWNFSIAIVNSEGNLIYFERNENAYIGSINASIQKAKSANAFQRPTSAFADGLKQGRYGLLTIENVTAIEGGIPILSGGKHIGAIGVSGAKATEDEECAKAAVE